IPKGSGTAQQRNAPDGQPLCYENIAALQEDCGVGRDELAWSKFASRLLAARTDFTVRGAAVAELRDNFVIAVENAHLAVQVRADHPFALRVEVARHTQPRVVLDGTKMLAIHAKGLQTTISAISNHEQ